MPRTLDIESVIEDSVIAHIKTFFDNNVTVKAWEDIKEKDLTESVKVKATLVDEEGGTVNYFVAERVLLTVGVSTSKRIDENGRAANALRGEVREFFNQSDIVTVLNTTEGLNVYNNGVIPQGSVDVSDDKLWQKNLIILIVATTS